MAPTRTPNQIAEQWENLGRCEEIPMANDIKALNHLEEISSNLDEIRRELSSLTNALGNIDARLVELRDTNSSLADIAKSLQVIAEKA